MITAPFYLHFGRDPWFNMACDDWMLASVQQRPGRMLVRLYTWSPGGITFGFNQRQETAVDHDHLDGMPLIRRVTGGRAIYHDESELTYAVAVNTSATVEGPLAGGLRDSSRALSEMLAAFVRHEGVQATLVRQSSPENARREFFHRAPCFDSRARHELVTPDRKVVASAQRRWKDSWLQHGSIKLRGVAPHPALGGASKRANGGALPALRREEFEALAHNFGVEFEEALNVRLKSAALTDEEDQSIRIRAVALRRNSLTKREID